MADRSIEVRLGLDVSSFESGAKRAEQAIGGVGDKTESLGKDTESIFSKATKHLRNNAADYRTVGAAAVGVGVAMQAVALGVAKTGVEYNVLQQSSRAALTAIMGSGEKANAQMDRLDAFAKTSPFAKQGFIQAQRTMLGFGIEANKVVPYLDAIQNATAAIGGNNNDIAQIVDVFAKIKSQGKMTARELMQLGVHGIDAATLIGDAMGKTGDQIRQEITAGALDADAALDALAQGMQGRFGGAAEAIKEQFEGALDRVKAAIRDFSSSAMTPFVNPEGGGLFVDWANGLADAIRWLDKLPGPAKTGMVTVTGLGGAALTAGGAFLLLAPRIVETIDAVTRLRGSSAIIDKFAGSLRAVGKVAGYAGIALAVGAAAKSLDGLVRSTQISVSDMGALEKSFISASDATRVLEQSFADISYRDNFLPWAQTYQFDSMTEALQRLTAPSLMEKTTDFMARIGTFGNWRGSGAAESVLKQIDGLNDAISNMVASGNTDQAVAAWDALAAAWVDAGGDLERLKELMPEAAAALESMGADVDTLASPWEKATESVGKYKAALSSLTEFQDAAADSVFKAREAVNEWSEATAEAAEKGLASATAADSYAQSTKQTVQQMLAAVDANGNYVYSLEDIQRVMTDGRSALAANSEAAYGNADAWRELAEMVGLTPEYVETQYALREDVMAQLQPILEALGGLPPDVITDILMRGGDEAILLISLVENALEEGIPPEKITEVLVETDLANANINDVIAAINGIPRDHNTDLNATDKTGRPVSGVLRSVSSIPTSKNTTITATDNASGTLTGIRTIITGINSKTVTITARYAASGSIAAGAAVAGKYAGGGPIWGPGTGTSDDVLIAASRDEHVWTAREVAMAGGHSAVYALRQAVMDGNLRLAEGGRPGMPMPVTPYPAYTPASSGRQVTVNLYDNSTTNNPVAVPRSVEQQATLQKAAALVGGLG